MKVTIEIRNRLYRDIKLEASPSGRSVQAVVDEALVVWLSAAEATEDRSSAAEALLEYEHDGGTTAEAFFG